MAFWRKHTAHQVPRPNAGALLGINEEAETLGGRTVVSTRRERGRLIRLLLVRGTRQSALWLDDPTECPFSYMDLFDLAFYANPKPQRVLMLGGAGYAWPRHILATEPDVDLTVVECDPMMNELARHWFLLDELELRHGETGDGRLHLVVDQGLAYLQACAQTDTSFDAIINDTFVAGKPAQSLMTEEAAELVRRCLTPNGIYLANVISSLTGSGSQPLETVCNAFTTQFEQVSVVPCDLKYPELMGNSVVIASDANQVFPGTWMTYAGISEDDAYEA